MLALLMHSLLKNGKAIQVLDNIKSQHLCSCDAFLLFFYFWTSKKLKGIKDTEGSCFSLLPFLSVHRFLRGCGSGLRHSTKHTKVGQSQGALE